MTWVRRPAVRSASRAVLRPASRLVVRRANRPAGQRAGRLMVRRASRLVVRLGGAMVLAIGLSVAVVGSASAHNVLISSDPADGSTLKSVPTSLSFTFDQPVQNFDPVISLIGPDGRQYATGTPSVSGNSVAGTIGTGPVGAYTGAYRIVSADGHPVTGEIHFTVAVAGTATGASVGGGGASNPTASGGGLSTGLWVGLGIAVVLVAGAVVLLLRRPRTARTAGDRDY